MSVAQPWHPYVFDSAGRRFVGAFEDMYRAEEREHFDSWRQSDPRLLESAIACLLLEQVTWSSVLDLGCGKGQFTAGLQRRDNHVTGVDAAETAIARARGAFPDVEWVCGDAAAVLRERGPVDLVVIRELLSYLEDWRELLALAASRTRYLLVGLYLPADPIGHVKSHDELLAALAGDFDVLEWVTISPKQLTTYLCRARAG